MKVLSCIPTQLYTVEDKLAWIVDRCAEYRPDIFVTPQEYFGGAVIMPDKKAFKQNELLPALQKIIKQYKTAMVVGLVELDPDGKNREVIWFINRSGEYLGRVVKFALPKYDHVCTNGYGNILPETNMENRFQVFDLDGLICGAIFCWEAYSNILWTGLSISRPDVVFSLIKFGVNSWPQVKKEADCSSVVKGFGYGTWVEEGGWIERLQMASKWQVKCPIICSTNSWNLRPVSMPLAGAICKIDGQMQAKESFWCPTKEMGLKKLHEVVVVDDIEPNRIRAALENKFIYKELNDEWPPYSLGRFTMMLKINRIENRILSGKEQRTVDKKLASQPQNKKGFFA